MGKHKKMRKLIKAAKMGKPYAMYQLGICYQLGRECQQDMNEAAAGLPVLPKQAMLRQSNG